MKTIRAHTFAFALFMALASCTGAMRELDPELLPDPVSLCTAQARCADTVVVTFLGVDGFVFRYGGTAVMTAPLFTHHGIVRTALGYPFRSDPAKIDAALHHMNVRLDDVSLLLVGHSHYDHLIDVPHIARSHLNDSARIIGTPSMKHILAGDSVAVRKAIAVPAGDAGSATKVGEWMYAADKRSRVMALESSHAPTLLGITFAPGLVTKDLDTLPSTALGWKLGEVYAYVIDFLDGRGAPVFRIFFQDAVSDPQYNVLPPFTGIDAHRVNLQIVVAGNFENAPDYPTTALKNLQPDRVIVGHWEDFFEPWDARPTVVPSTNTKKLKQRLQDAAPDRWMTPMPGAVMKYAFSVTR